MDLILGNPIPLPLSELVPPAERFAHTSRIHGPDHVGRVLIHAFLLLRLTAAREETTRLWASVYVHDLARTHDGVCTHHGADAARLLETDETLRGHLARGGLTEADLPAVAAAVTAHSLWEEIPRDDPHGRLAALMKDVDGLDRVRLHDLDPAMLRHDEARTLVPFAKLLYERTDGRIPHGSDHFPALFEKARRLLEG
jgi:hypothetical protein